MTATLARTPQGRRYGLTTEWVLAAPVERVWEALAAPLEWPRWWRYVDAVVPLRDGDADGVGAIRRYTWTSRLPYRLTFDMETTRVARPVRIEGVARGELNGLGRWELAPLAQGTSARYEWTVMTGKGWMNALGPLLAPVFEWNHDQVMAEGGRGLSRHLGVPLLAYSRTAR
jgi:uncharacterized protein YndB with AHSA1/START domain